MKRILIAILSIVTIVIAVILLLPNQFSKISSVEYQKYDIIKEEYEEVVSIVDKEKLKQLRQSLNKAKHEKNKIYEIETSHDIQATIHDENGESVIIYFWLDFSPETTLFKVENREGTFKLKREKNFFQLFNQ